MTDGQPAARLPRWRRVLDTLTSVSIVVACAVLIWRMLGQPGRAPAERGPVPSGSVAAQRPVRSPQRPGGALPAAPLSLAGAATKGSSGARVAIIEFSDFQCPFCSRFSSETRPRLEQTYVNSGQVLWAFRHLPLETLHPTALRAAEAFECAARSGRAWEMHRRLFDQPKALSDAAIARYATSLGIGGPAFETCMRGESKPKIRADMEAARVLGVAGTPAFLIGVRRPDNLVDVKATLFGAQPFDKFKAEIDKLRLTND